MTINLTTLNIQDVIQFLTKNNIKFSETDNISEHEVLLNEESPLYLRIDHKRGILRIYGWATLKDNEKDVDSKVNSDALNLMNTGSNSIKYSFLGESGVLYEYGIILKGNVDEEFLKETIKNVDEITSVFKGVFMKFINKVKELKAE
ncbi:hypothetical protein A3N57_01640 [Enterobacter cloacae subsp. dissolvens]|uniref:hypothetical protein n=1 Tax=Enterobacter cloacae TaxID=550 RepID=UPI0007B3E6B2|nr:hypothetical protein [Enterobacter cloacae]KZQ41875.1 hypothetical protein A3N57_01640 [Enterobacter cloacae subsp. dissolvens]HBH7063415.1 hypothetical protein [Enterobacter cloacae]